MKKRKPFFFKGNFQLRFLFYFVAVLAIGIFFTTFLIFDSLKDVVEEAAFSSHLGFQSSGELFWRIILDVNLLVACISVFTALMLIGGVHLYLQRFFRYLAGGLCKLSQGDFSFRLKPRGNSQCRGLLRDFNATAIDMDKRRKEIKALIDYAIIGTKAVNHGQKEKFGEIKSIHDKLCRKLLR